MEVVGVKRSRNRKKRKHVKKRRRDQVKFEVKSLKQRRQGCERKNISFAKEKFIQSTMQADSFWENYTAAQEWQKRHSVTWWRSRCFALEYENQILRDKIRSLVSQSNQQYPQTLYNNKQNIEEEEEEEDDDDDEGEDSVENENFEFHVNEDMLSFLEQSIRHKMELKKKKESESMAAKENVECTEIRGGAAWIRERNEGAKLLYGESSATILAMETALQTTIDRHEDKAKPQYWPVIPLKP